MTRESKIGLIVAGSFLCLVCIVVASKWNRNGAVPKGDPTESSEPKVAAAKPTQNQPAPDPKKGDAKKGPVLPPSLPALPVHPEKGGDLKNTGGTSEPRTLPPLVLPPPVSVGENKKETPLPLPPTLPLPKNEAPTPPTLPAFPALEKKDAPAPALPSFPALDRKDPPIVDAKTPPPILPKSDVITFPPPQPITPVDDKKTIGFPPKKDVNDVPPPAIIGIAPVLPDNKQPTIKPENPPTNLQPIKPFDAKDPVPAFPGINVAPPALPAKDGFPMPPAVKPDPNDFVRPAFPSNDPPVTLLPPNSPRIGPMNDLPSTPVIPNGSFRPNPGTLPVVKETLAEIYQCKPGDTSLAIVSLRLYGDDKYADALLAYNRAHAYQIKQNADSLSNPQNLVPGQLVLHPPVGILERDYASLIRGNSQVPTIPSTTPPVKLATPSPIGTIPPVTAVSNPPVNVGGTYQVKSPNGESILDIAERVLGNRARWHEIYRVNPSYQPQFRIPAGTVLKMPTN